MKDSKTLELVEPVSRWNDDTPPPTKAPLQRQVSRPHLKPQTYKSQTPIAAETPSTKQSLTMQRFLQPESKAVMESTNGSARDSETRDLPRLQRQYEDHELRLNKQESAMRVRDRNLTDLEITVENIREEVQRCNRKLASHDTDLATQKASITNCEDGLNNMTSEVGKQHRRISEQVALQRMNDFSGESDGLDRTTIRQMQDQIDKLQRTMANFQTTLADMRSAIKTENRNITREGTFFDQLENMMKSYKNNQPEEVEMQQLRAENKTMKQRLSRMTSIMGDAESPAPGSTIRSASRVSASSPPLLGKRKRDESTNRQATLRREDSSIRKANGLFSNLVEQDSAMLTPQSTVPLSLELADSTQQDSFMMCDNDRDEPQLRTTGSSGRQVGLHVIRQSREMLPSNRISQKRQDIEHGTSVEDQDIAMDWQDDSVDRPTRQNEAHGTTENTDKGRTSPGPAKPAAKAILLNALEFSDDNDEEGEFNDSTFSFLMAQGHSDTADEILDQPGIMQSVEVSEDTPAPKDMDCDQDEEEKDEPKPINGMAKYRVRFDPNHIYSPGKIAERLEQSGKPVEVKEKLHPTEKRLRIELTKLGLEEWIRKNRRCKEYRAAVAQARANAREARKKELLSKSAPAEQRQTVPSSERRETEKTAEQQQTAPPVQTQAMHPPPPPTAYYGQSQHTSSFRTPAYHNVGYIPYPQHQYSDYSPSPYYPMGQHQGYPMPQYHGMPPPTFGTYDPYLQTQYALSPQLYPPPTAPPPRHRIPNGPALDVPAAKKSASSMPLSQGFGVLKLPAESVQPPENSQVIQNDQMPTLANMEANSVHSTKANTKEGELQASPVNVGGHVEQSEDNLNAEGTKRVGPEANTVTAAGDPGAKKAKRKSGGAAKKAPAKRRSAQAKVDGVTVNETEIETETTSETPTEESFIKPERTASKRKAIPKPAEPEGPGGTPLNGIEKAAKAVDDAVNADMSASNELDITVSKTRSIAKRQSAALAKKTPAAEDNSHDADAEATIETDNPQTQSKTKAKRQSTGRPRKTRAVEVVEDAEEETTINEDAIEQEKGSMKNKRATRGRKSTVANEPKNDELTIDQSVGNKDESTAKNSTRGKRAGRPKKATTAEEVQDSEAEKEIELLPVVQIPNSDNQEPISKEDSQVNPEANKENEDITSSATRKPARPKHTVVLQEQREEEIRKRDKMAQDAMDGEDGDFDTSFEIEGQATLYIERL